ncbi:STAS domain-containing protein [Streptomyces sp. NPDC059944]|uniref:STAS domain-containing protein n=1 Tax=unclassified Streptomyces TaxID=2593676 RepID=UPI003654E82A
MTDLTITTRTAAAGPVIEVCGELDYATVPGFRETVIGLSLVQGDLLTVDLAGLSYCDSTGLTALVCAHDLALERGAGMVLAAVSDDSPGSCPLRAWASSSLSVRIPSRPFPGPRRADRT